MQHIALEGRCFVLSACQFATEKDYPPDHAVADPNNRNPDNIMINGGSVIISPLGKVLAGPTRQPEEILTADLDLDDVVRGKLDLDSVGHYARPDGMVTCFPLAKLQLIVRLVFQLKANIPSH
jgi:beta-cyano-L-alanine hydratase/nitrilase